MSRWGIEATVVAGGMAVASEGLRRGSKPRWRKEIRMSRSIFDPTGPYTERSGSRNLGPDAGNISHMPPDVVDGEVSEQEVRDADALRDAEEKNLSAADALGEMTAGSAAPPERTHDPDRDDSTLKPGD
jgi:hypothetical protein